MNEITTLEEFLVRATSLKCESGEKQQGLQFEVPGTTSFSTGEVGFIIVARQHDDDPVKCVTYRWDVVSETMRKLLKLDALVMPFPSYCSVFERTLNIEFGTQPGPAIKSVMWRSSVLEEGW